MRENRRAASPAISTVILTSAVVVLLLVAIVFANNFLDVRMAENEFAAVKQFMQTIGLQMDDVCWTIGRTQTIRYTSRFGEVDFESVALNYTVFVNNNPVVNFTTGILLFNMPSSKYNMGNNYYQGIYPSSDRSFLQRGTSAPVCHVFVIEKLPMIDGNYIRVVAAPAIRLLNSTINTSGSEKNYYRFYLPVLNQTTHPRRSQSVTLIGNDVSAETQGSVNSIRIHLGFPKASIGLDNTFFKFDDIDETVSVVSSSVMEFYTGEVIVSIGLHV